MLGVLFPHKWRVSVKVMNHPEFTHNGNRLMSWNTIFLSVFGPVTHRMNLKTFCLCHVHCLGLTKYYRPHNPPIQCYYNEKHGQQHTGFLKACNHNKRNKQLYVKTSIPSKLTSSYWQLISIKRASAVFIVPQVFKGH